MSGKAKRSTSVSLTVEQREALDRLRQAEYERNGELPSLGATVRRVVDCGLKAEERKAG